MAALNWCIVQKKWGCLLARKNDDTYTDTSLSFHLIQAFGKANDLVSLIAK